MIVHEIEKVWLSNKEAQRYLDVSVDFLKDLRLNGELHFYKVHNTIFYKKSDIDRFIEKHKVT